MTPAESSCALTVRIDTSAPVVVRARRGMARGAGELVPLPEGAYFTIDACALMFDVKVQTMWNLLSTHDEWFSKPKMYRRGRDHRWRRLLREEDYQVLRRFYPVRIMTK